MCLWLKANGADNVARTVLRQINNKSVGKNQRSFPMIRRDLFLQTTLRLFGFCEYNISSNVRRYVYIGIFGELPQLEINLFDFYTSYYPSKHEFAHRKLDK